MLLNAKQRRLARHLLNQPANNAVWYLNTVTQSLKDEIWLCYDQITTVPDALRVATVVVSIQIRRAQVAGIIADQFERCAKNLDIFEKCRYSLIWARQTAKEAGDNNFFTVATYNNVAKAVNAIK